MIRHVWLNPVLTQFVGARPVFAVIHHCSLFHCWFRIGSARNQWEVLLFNRLKSLHRAKSVWLYIHLGPLMMEWWEAFWHFSSTHWIWNETLSALSLKRGKSNSNWNQFLCLQKFMLSHEHQSNSTHKNTRTFLLWAYSTHHTGPIGESVPPVYVKLQLPFWQG